MDRYTAAWIMLYVGGFFVLMAVVSLAALGFMTILEAACSG